MESGIIEPDEMTHGKNPSIWHLLECLHFAPFYSPPLLAMFLEPWKYLWDSHSLARNVSPPNHAGKSIKRAFHTLWPRSDACHHHQHIPTATITSGVKLPHIGIFETKDIFEPCSSLLIRNVTRKHIPEKIGFVNGLSCLINSACFNK